MVAAHRSNLIDAATGLDHETVDVWRLDYRPAQKRGPLLQTLAAYLGVDADQVRLVEGAHGRPRLDSVHASTLEFNWSHSGRHALMAIAHGIAPGIDIERRRPRPRALALARRFFADDEAAALATLPEADRADAFLELWTAKEALLKAHGRGIGFGLQRVHVVSDGDELRLLRFDDEAIGAWQLHRLALAPDLVAALAWRGRPRRIRLGLLASAD
jgi:4'-phosphopantetheinyl transferase